MIHLSKEDDKDSVCDGVTVTRISKGVTTVTEFRSSGVLSISKSYPDKGLTMCDTIEGTYEGNPFEESGKLKVKFKTASFGARQTENGALRIKEYLTLHSGSFAIQNYQEDLYSAPGLQKCRRSFVFTKDGTLKSCTENGTKIGDNHKCSDKFFYKNGTLTMYLKDYDSKNNSWEDRYTPDCGFEGKGPQGPFS